MVIILDTATSKTSSEIQQQIFCCYHNVTNQIQIIKIENIDNWYLEHITFPGERFLFEAPFQAELQVYQNTSDGKISCQSIQCDRLQVEAL
jgi:hypothetical protein